MASSLSRSTFSSFLLNSPILKPRNFYSPFCTKSLSSSESSDSDSEGSLFELDYATTGRRLTDMRLSEEMPKPLPVSSSSPSSDSTEKRRSVFELQLEDGLDVGIYKAILVGKVGQLPVQKKLKNGTTVTLLSLGTGGIRNNRRPLDNEDPKEYANRCAIQWHRVSVYPPKLGELAMKNAVQGSVLYVEGNLEAKVFNDPITGLVRRVREVAIRRSGRLVFLGKGSNVLG